jgi:hypothetical protein
LAETLKGRFHLESLSMDIRAILTGQESHMGVMRTSYDILGRNPEGKVPLGEFEHGYKGDIKI